MSGDEEARESEGATLKPTGADNTRADRLLADQDVQIFQEVLKREQKPCGYPDRRDIEAMEEPLYRLMGAVVLFQDLAVVTRREEAPRPIGLSFLAHAMNREALRLYRLYHGHPPSDQ